MDNPSNQPGGTGEEDSVPGTDGEVSVVIGNPEKVYKIPANFKDNLNSTEKEVSVWNKVANTQQSDILGRNYSILLGDNPKTDGYVISGSATEERTNLSTGPGSYRIPAITKAVVNNQVRLIAAFDVRYRGGHDGGGDTGASANGGSDITIMYSDDGGATWTAAKNKDTGKKPAIDVKNLYNDRGLGDGSPSQTDTFDVCDPQLSVAPDGIVYCGMAAGNGTIGTAGGGPNFRMWKSTDNGETWEEVEGSSGDGTTGIFKTWSIEESNGLLTTPGHGIILTKDVPGSSNFTKGRMVMPVFQKQKVNSENIFRMYLATGTGKPETWDSSTFSAPFTRNHGVEEGQICQLDDGSLLMFAKTYVTSGSGADAVGRFTLFKDNKWNEVHESDQKLIGGQSGQGSILKVAEGDGTTKAGVIAFAYTGQKTQNRNNGNWGNIGRGDITIALTRDVSALNSNGEPLDSERVYYLKIRTPRQGYFGYTDMVMIDDKTLGILYENYSGEKDSNKGDLAPDGTNAVNGMRFCRIDIGEIIKDLQN